MIDKHTNRGWGYLPDISKALYKETYFIASETYEDWLHRITTPYQNDEEHGNRIRTYIHNYWYHPSTPISSGRGLPISCYVSHTDDSNAGIFDGNHEASWLGAEGGGVGRYWGDVGGAGRPIRKPLEELSSMTWSQIQSDKSIMKSSGVIPFLGVPDRYTYSISQAGNRRATEAAYLPISHPDILDFIEIRLETGDRNRRTPNLHHGICITDAFMEAVDNLKSWDLICPHTKVVTNTVDAFDLWMKILEIRKTETGEPYLLFIDTVNSNRPPEYKTLDMKVSSSNICTEITLFTDKDTTCVCNLGSLNLEFWDEYSNDINRVIADLSDFHDNVNTVFLELTSKFTGMKAEAFKKVRKAVIEERNIGIGTMGFHSLTQRKNMPFESPMVKALNINIFKTIREASDLHQLNINNPCPIALKAGTHRRNIHSIAIAPTMSISNLCNLASSGVEPWVTNSFTKKLIQGSFVVRNSYLEKYIKNYWMQHSEYPQADIDETWKSINKYGGSIQHLDWVDTYTKDVFKTAFEIDQRTIISLAADRQKYIDQAQSINLFFTAACTYEELHAVHFMAWKEGLKSLYYLRSEPETTADAGNRERRPITLEDDACTSCT